MLEQDLELQQELELAGTPKSTSRGRTVGDIMDAVQNPKNRMNTGNTTRTTSLDIGSDTGILDRCLRYGRHKKRSGELYALQDLHANVQVCIKQLSTFEGMRVITDAGISLVRALLDRLAPGGSVAARDEVRRKRIVGSHRLASHLIG